MGSCLSKKNAPADPGSSGKKPDNVKVEAATNTNKKVMKNQVAEEEGKADLGLVKKEIFVIKHRNTHHHTPAHKRFPPQNIPDVDANAKASAADTSDSNNNSNNLMPRTSSCTKEEVDAILIQCGRLSRSNSPGCGARKYSGSKRSYDLDHDVDDQTAHGNKDDDEDERRQCRHRDRQSSKPSPSSPGGRRRRRTPSREREPQQHRSGSRERSSGGSGSRRVSRSPGRRSETTQQSNTNTNNAASNRPAKMVSVPATVSSSLAVEPQTTTAITRIAVKRNAGEARGAASPRSQSPARTNANQQQLPSPSRSSSRKAEQSPCKRNPLSEIDTNSLPYPQPTGNRTNTRNKQAEGQVQLVKQSVNVHNQTPLQKPNTEKYNRVSNRTGSLDNQVAEEQTQATMAANLAESLNGQTQALTRSRSGRRSRDFDANPLPSYTTLLLEDIQNFHQKNTPSFSLPACVRKACSILEAVADLNSTTSSNLSERSANLHGKRVSDAAGFAESEVLASDDLMEPSFHRYVTVRRGGVATLCREVMDDDDGQESSGSNSFVGGGRGFSTSTSLGPNSADSTSRSIHTREEIDERSPFGFHSRESDRDMEQARRGFSGQRTGIGRRRAGNTDNNLHTTLVAAAATST